MTNSEKHLLHPTYRPDIDGLRAVAVLSVVAFHAFPEWARGGFIGVDIFFVISGFLISTIIFESLNREAFSFLEFYARRIRRIFPALIVVLFSCYAFGWFALLASEYQQLGKHIAGGAGFISNLVLWTEAGYFDNSAETKPLLHLWSLGIEEQFYIVFPFFVWLAWKRNLNLLTLTVVIALVSFYLNVTGMRKDAVATFYMPYTRVWELLCGSLLAWVTLYKKEFVTTSTRWLKGAVNRHSRCVDGKQLANMLSVLGVLLLAYGFWRIDKNSGFPGKLAVIPVFGAALIIAAGPKAWVNRLFLSHKAAVWFGLISFPLYLWHWPILAFSRIIENEAPSMTVRFLAVLLSIALAWATYRLIERPVRFGSKSKAKVAWLATIMVVVGSVGYLTSHFHGFVSRSSVQGFVDNTPELSRTATVDSGCVSYLGRGDLVQYCRFEDAGGRQTFAIVGDSHAHVAFPGIAALLRDKGVNTVMLANGACPPLVGVPYGTTQSARELCRKRVQDLIELLVHREDISSVILFSRGSIYMSGTEPLSGEAEVMNGQHLSAENYELGLQATIDTLVNAGKKVFYVTENPELAVSPGACIQRPFRTDTKQCKVSLPAVLVRQKDYRKFIFQLKNVQLLDSLEVFCMNGVCSAFDDQGSLLYADDDHLSVAGSKFLATRLLAPHL
jgi:peptidoglycan/LPS O-acetylase OafA/YrhL